MIEMSKDGALTQGSWQAEFLALLPDVQRRLRQAFRHRDAAAREEATADGIMHCLLAYSRLHAQGRADSATASSLAWYAAKQVRRGRTAGCRLNSQEPLALYAQRRRGFRTEPLQSGGPSERTWIDAMVQGRRSSVLDQVAARLDIAAWLATLCRRTRRIAVDLAIGGTTADVARKYGVTAGRISQLRRELAQSSPRTQPIYELRRESADSYSAEWHAITEFASDSVRADRTQPFTNF